MGWLTNWLISCRNTDDIHELEGTAKPLRPMQEQGRSYQVKMKQFQSNANDILGRMKHIEEFCDVTLLSDDGERILAHKVVLASASTIFRKMFETYKEDEDQVISMRGVQSNFINSMVNLIYNGETEVKLIECDEFMNILKGTYHLQKCSD